MFLIRHSQCTRQATRVILSPFSPWLLFVSALPRPDLVELIDNQTLLDGTYFFDVLKKKSNSLFILQHSPWRMCPREQFVRTIWWSVGIKKKSSKKSGISNILEISIQLRSKRVPQTNQSTRRLREQHKKINSANILMIKKWPSSLPKFFMSDVDVVFCR